MQSSISVRLVMCKGRHCNANGQAEPLYEHLCDALGPPADFTQRHKLVRWEIANCLSHCDIGPNFVFYPAGRFFHHVDQESLAEIVDEYNHHKEQLGE